MGNHSLYHIIRTVTKLTELGLINWVSASAEKSQNFEGFDLKTFEANVGKFALNITSKIKTTKFLRITRENLYFVFQVTNNDNNQKEFVEEVLAPPFHDPLRKLFETVSEKEVCSDIQKEFIFELIKTFGIKI